VVRVAWISHAAIEVFGFDHDDAAGFLVNGGIQPWHGGA
jgi:hypothetical protein